MYTIQLKREPEIWYNFDKMEIKINKMLKNANGKNRQQFMQLKIEQQTRQSDFITIRHRIALCRRFIIATIY